MKVLVCGGRDYGNYDKVEDVLCRLHKEQKILILMHGGAKGADSLAWAWAINNDVETQLFIADWETHGKRAGPIRNQQMLKEGNPDLVVAFPGGKGTAHMVRIAKKANVPIIEVKSEFD